MAVGRVEFYRNYLAGLQRKQVLTPSGRGRPPPVWRGVESGGQKRLASHRGAPSVHWSRKERKIKDVDQFKFPTSQLHHLDSGGERYCSMSLTPPPRLPEEVLMKILSFLDGSSLFRISHVSLLFHRLANDNVLWRRLYMMKFGSRMWRMRAEPDPRAEPPLGHWKKMFCRAVAGREADRWKRELRNIRASMGLPRDTQHILRDLKVSWELTLYDQQGQEVALREGRADFLQASVLLHWSQSFILRLQHIRSLQLHGLRRDAPRMSTVSSPSTSSSLTPGWRSLILKLDLQRERWNVIGADPLVKLVLLSQGVLVGVWRGTNTVAFILISLHFHKLVEKSVLGSPACPYSELCDPQHVPANPLLHAFSLHLVLNNMAAEILSGHFLPVSCRRVRFDPNVLEIRVVDGSRSSQLHLLSGNIQLQWKSAEQEGAVESCCVMTLTLLDCAQTPCWCVSSPVRVRPAPEPRPCAAYAGHNFLVDHLEPGGSVRMRLIRLREQRQYFLVSLVLYVSLPPGGGA